MSLSKVNHSPKLMEKWIMDLIIFHMANRFSPGNRTPPACELRVCRNVQSILPVSYYGTYRNDTGKFR
jgi:hypothetical protein